VRSTTGSIRDNGVIIAAKEDPDIVSRQLARFIAISGMRVQRAAAALTSRYLDFNAVLREHLHGRPVQVLERDVIDTAGEKCNFATALAYGWISLADFAEEKLGVDLRRKLLHIGHTQQLCDSNGPRQGLQSGSLIEPHQACHEF